MDPLTTDKSTYSELEGLIERTFLFRTATPTRVLAFLGTQSEDFGTGEVAAKVAITLAANSSSPICLVDANLDFPSLDKFFSLTATSGLCKALEQPASAATLTQKVGSGSLHVLLAGNAGKLSWTSDQFHDRFVAVLSALMQAYEYIVIVSPSIESFSRVSTVASMANGMVLVIEAGSTRKKVAIKAAGDLRTANIPVLGVVLNNRSYPIPEFIYDHL
jgi:Mrp family chromosome partitioning ATPase